MHDKPGELVSRVLSWEPPSSPEPDLYKVGGGDRTRTCTPLREEDFKSPASTSSATPASPRFYRASDPRRRPPPAPLGYIRPMSRSSGLPGDSRFRTTRWSVVLAAGGSTADSPARSRRVGNCNAISLASTVKSRLATPPPLTTYPPADGSLTRIVIDPTDGVVLGHTPASTRRDARLSGVDHRRGSERSRRSTRARIAAGVEIRVGIARWLVLDTGAIDAPLAVGGRRHKRRRRQRRWSGRNLEMSEDAPDGGRLGDEREDAPPSATVGTTEHVDQKHPRQQLRPGERRRWLPARRSIGASVAASFAGDEVSLVVPSRGKGGAGRCARQRERLANTP